jgi:Dyp-type peroxidase family
MDISREAPIKPEDCPQLLSNLQGNILKSHRRTHVSLLLLRVTSGNEIGLKRWIRKTVLPELRSAADQLAEPQAPADRGEVGGFGSFLLTVSGYQKLGFPAAALAQLSPELAAGMAAAGEELGDPRVDQWEELLRSTPANPLDAMLLLADDQKDRLDATCNTVKDSFAGLGTVHREEGRVLKEDPPPPSGDPETIEPFGYVDGISQPRFFQDDLNRDAATKGGIETWNPLAPLGLVLVPDPFIREEDCFGSFLVFRKLAQNVGGFQANILLAANPDQRGAEIVGRFKDGSTILGVNGSGRLFNNFDYSGPNGNRCPVQAHARAANPRLPAERNRRIVRRGIPYEQVATGSQGMLFISYQASIADQFVFIQKRLASQDSNFSRFITLRGGEYFFAPSLPFLHGLGA